MAELGRFKSANIKSEKNQGHTTEPYLVWITASIPGIIR